MYPWCTECPDIVESFEDSVQHKWLVAAHNGVYMSRSLLEVLIRARRYACKVVVEKGKGPLDHARERSETF